MRCVVSGALHWIRMWITEKCSPHLLHEGLGEPVSRWECFACVWPIRDRAKVTSVYLLRAPGVDGPKCGFITCSLLSVCLFQSAYHLLRMCCLMCVLRSVKGTDVINVYYVLESSSCSRFICHLFPGNRTEARNQAYYSSSFSLYTTITAL